MTGTHRPKHDPTNQETLRPFSWSITFFNLSELKSMSNQLEIIRVKVNQMTSGTQNKVDWLRSNPFPRQRLDGRQTHSSYTFYDLFGLLPRGPRSHESRDVSTLSNLVWELGLGLEEWPFLPFRWPTRYRHPLLLWTLLRAKTTSNYKRGSYLLTFVPELDSGESRIGSLCWHLPKQEYFTIYWMTTV